jgi:hypothetical protein
MRVEAIGPARTMRWTMQELLPSAFRKEQLT